MMGVDTSHVILHLSLFRDAIKAAWTVTSAELMFVKVRLHKEEEEAVGGGARVVEVVDVVIINREG